MTHRILLSAALVTVAALVGCKSDTHRPTNTSKTPTTFHAPASQPASLATRLDEILNRHATKGAFVVARVVDPKTGEELFAQDIDRPVTPASNMKITVASAALEFFGPDHEFTTDLWVSGPNLFLIGRGDPATGDAAIARQNKVDPLAFIDVWADELKVKAGGKTKFATLFFDDDVFESQQIHPDWNSGDLVEWYAAPVGGLNLNGNCVDITVEPSDQPATMPAGATQPVEPPAILSAVPETTASITLINKTVSTTDKTTTKPSTEPEVERAQDLNTYTVTGRVWEKKTLQSKPVTDPGAFFADAVKTRLAKHGITIDTIDRKAGLPGTIPSTHQMWPLTPVKTKFRDVLWRIMKNSQNLYAEGVAKQLGRWKNSQPPADRTDPRGVAVPLVEGSWTNAEAAVRAFLAKHDIDDRQYVFADASGLSGKNKVTSRLISDIYVAMYKSKHFDVWKNSQTIAGVDGTTRNRLKDKPNRVFCKTGYISGVRSLSGYVVTDSGRTLVFSFIYNGITPRGSEATKPYEALQDEALRLLMAQ